MNSITRLFAVYCRRIEKILNLSNSPFSKNSQFSKIKAFFALLCLLCTYIFEKGNGGLVKNISNFYDDSCNS